MIGFRFKKDEAVHHGILRIYRSELKKIRDALEEAGDGNGNHDDAIHAARKRFKKLRALLRLVRYQIGKDTYTAENHRFRDAARELAGPRDARVLVQTWDSLTKNAGNNEVLNDSGRNRWVRDRLTAGYQNAVDELLESRQPVPEVMESIDQAAEYAAEWCTADITRDVVLEGARKQYGRAEKSMAAAWHAPTFENCHEWRKKVKHLWHQMQLMTSVWPPVMKAYADQLHELSNLLGEDHDLAVLCNWLGETAAHEEDAGLREVQDLIREQQEKLRIKAYNLGARLFVESPRQFADRLGGYWDAWHSPGTVSGQ